MYLYRKYGNHGNHGNLSVFMWVSRVAVSKFYGNLTATFEVKSAHSTFVFHKFHTFSCQQTNQHRLLQIVKK